MTLSLVVARKIFIGILIVGSLVGVWGTIFVSPVLADVACGWECDGPNAVCKPGGDETFWGYGCWCRIWCEGSGCKTSDVGPCIGSTVCCSGQWRRRTAGYCSAPEECAPSWRCESPLNCYEYDTCGNRRYNASCCPEPCPNPTYPTTTWDRVWCNRNLDTKIGDTPDEPNTQFNNNWGTGNVGGHRADDIGFRSGRIVNFPVTGTYRFTLGSDDGARLWIDDTLRIDRWYDTPYSTTSVDVSLTAGNHKFRIDYYENGWDARVSFSYVTPWPDLITQNLLPSPASPVAGSNMSFSGVVKNQGAGSAGASSTRLRLDVNNDGISWDWLPGNQPTGALAPYATETETWSGWTAVSGTHRYEICADVGGVVSESNEGNNCATQTFSVQAVGTITGRVWNDSGYDEGNPIDSSWCNVNPDPAQRPGIGSITVRYDPPGTSTTTLADGRYWFNNVPVGSYNVSVTVPPGWYATTPVGCQVAVGENETKTAYFGLSNNPGAWFQGVNGDIYGNGISVSVPSEDVWNTNPPSGYNRWFLDADPAATSGGVVISGNVNLTCGTTVDGRCSQRPSGDLTEPGWRVADEQMAWPSLPSLTPSGDPISWDSLVPGKVYFRTSLSPSDHYNLTGPGVAVIYVRGGDLNFTTNYFCSGPPPDPCGSNAWKTKGLIFVVENGNVIINQDVRRIHALILVINGTITVGGTNVANNLVVRGMLYAQNGITFARTLNANADLTGDGISDGNRVPAVQVRYNPLYLLPNPLARSQITWREIAP